MSYFSNPKKAEGGERQVVVSDEDLAQLLEEILKELKKVNLQLAILTDTYVTNQEVE